MMQRLPALLFSSHVIPSSAHLTQLQKTSGFFFFQICENCSYLRAFAHVTLIPASCPLCLSLNVTFSGRPFLYPFSYFKCIPLALNRFLAKNK